MKRFMLFITTMVVMGSFSLNVLAKDDPKYPGYDFKPAVVYRSAELLAELSQVEIKPKVTRITPKADAKYAAAYFMPSVVYPLSSKK